MSEIPASAATSKVTFVDHIFSAVTRYVAQRVLLFLSLCCIFQHANDARDWHFLFYLWPHDI